MKKDYKHLNREQRNIIELLLGRGCSFTEIGKAINVDRTTVAKEIKRNRYIKKNDREYNQRVIANAVNRCKRLNKPPYVCNKCESLRHCYNGKLYYNARTAQEHYEETLSCAREGIDIDYETIDEIEHIVVPLIKDNNQSINQVYINHSDILYMSKVTFYKYVNDGVFSLINLDLPKKVKYKPRKKKNENEKNEHKRKLAVLKGRTYTDFLDFISKHPNMHIFEMDTVIGKQNENKVLLTLYFRDTHLMLIRLLDKKNIEYVAHEFEILKSTLGIKLYAKVFRVGLTDNGSEFLNPYCIEKDYESKRKVSNLFYCDPNRPDQKAGIEKNHEYIRKVFPKGTSFKNLNDEIIKNLENNINNVPRDVLDGKTPYELTYMLYPEVIEKLGIQYIRPDDVTLNIDHILNDRKGSKGDNNVL